MYNKHQAQTKTKPLTAKDSPHWCSVPELHCERRSQKSVSLPAKFNSQVSHQPQLTMPSAEMGGLKHSRFRLDA
jgi:hypothetical protein